MERLLIIRIHGTNSFGDPATITSQWRSHTEAIQWARKMNWTAIDFVETLTRSEARLSYAGPTKHGGYIVKLQGLAFASFVNEEDAREFVRTYHA